MKHIIGGKQSSAEPKAKLIVVDEDSAGQRLDNFLVRELKGVPKSHIYRIIRSGEVRINKARCSADSRINDGDIVRLPPVKTSLRAEQKKELMTASGSDGPGSTAFVPARDFPVLFEDDYFLAVNKPSGVAVHGGSGISFGVIEQLRMARPQAKFLELVHRLDRETSGILLVAKKRSALKNLQDQFRSRETNKIYLAAVSGSWPDKKKVLNKPLLKYLVSAKDAGGDQEGERRVKVVSADEVGAMPSLTLVKVFSKSGQNNPSGQFSLLEVTIKTGRTHQIRVHLASEGMPILGDDKYGDFELNKSLARGSNEVPLKRMFLHAWHLGLKHPSTNKEMLLRAPLPCDLDVFAKSMNLATPEE